MVLCKEGHKKGMSRTFVSRIPPLTPPPPKCSVLNELESVEKRLDSARTRWNFGILEFSNLEILKS